MRQQIESGEAILLDVRSTQEWTEGHVKFALHLPVTELDEGRLPIGLPEDKILYVHCRTGRRSTRATWILREKFPCVVNVTYNLDDYRAAGWPIR